MKYKIGDKVKIISSKYLFEYHKHLIGKVTKIIKVESGFWPYRIEIGDFPIAIAESELRRMNWIKL